jgi:hypothetical protein
MVELDSICNVHCPLFELVIVLSVSELGRCLYPGIILWRDD